MKRLWHLLPGYPGDNSNTLIVDSHCQTIVTSIIHNSIKLPSGSVRGFFFGGGGVMKATLLQLV